MSSTQSDDSSSTATKPSISQQTEFQFGDNDGEDGDDSEGDFLEVKEESVEVGLDSFGVDISNRNKNKETRIEQPDCSLYADRRDLSELQGSDQETLIHPVAEDQQTLEGDNAQQHTEVVEVACSEKQSDDNGD